MFPSSTKYTKSCKLKLLLINPKNEYKSTYKNYSFIPPLSLGIIADLTPNHWDVEIFDENIKKTQIISEIQADLVGITTNTRNINHVYALSIEIKNKGIPVILGGAHVSIFHEEALKFCDTVVIGEVETIWRDVIKDFESECLKNIYVQKSFKINTHNPKYFAKSYVIDSIETSRGCVNNCSFCGVHVPMYRPYERKSIDSVIAEIEASENDLIMFVDNNFYANDDDYLYQLFDRMIKIKNKKKWQSGVTTNFFRNKGLVEMAAKAGAVMFFVGFESDSTKSLKELNKKNLFSHDMDLFNNYKTIVELCHKNNILVSGNYMIGLENDTDETIQNRLHFFQMLKLDECACAILTPLPNTAIYKKAQKENKLIKTNYPNDWSFYSYSNSIIKHSNLSNERIEELMIIHNRKHKPNFLKILKILFNSKSLKATKYYYFFCKYLGKYNNKIIDKCLDFI